MAKKAQQAAPKPPPEAEQEPAAVETPTLPETTPDNTIPPPPPEAEQGGQAVDVFAPVYDDDSDGDGDDLDDDDFDDDEIDDPVACIAVTSHKCINGKYYRRDARETFPRNAVPRHFRILPE